MLPHEHVGENPDAFEDGIGLVLIAPDLFQIVDGVYLFLVLLYVGKKVADGELAFLEDRLYDCQMLLHVFLDEAKDSFPIIFGDILGLILIMVIILFFPFDFSLFELPFSSFFNTIILFLRVMFKLNMTCLLLLKLRRRLSNCSISI